jgi:glycosyltransferase involved in cell wall biosynthesis
MIIVHVLTRLMRAGAEENTLAVCRLQQARGHQVVILHGAEFDSSMVAEARREFDVYQLDRLVHRLSPMDDWAAVAEIRVLLRALNATAVHTHQSKAGIVGRVAARLEKTPIVIHGVHILPWTNISPGRRMAYILAEKICARWTDAFVDVSPSVRADYLKRRVGRPESHFVQLSPMNVGQFVKADWPEDWQSVLDVRPGDDKPPTMLMLASFEPRKRHAELLEALADAHLPPNTRVLFAGDGPEVARAQRIARSLGLQETVRFLGHRYDPERLIALADVCIHTSEREGLPRVLVQYLAGARAMVVTRLPGLEDVLAHGENGMIVEDVRSAALCAASLLRNKTSRDRLAAAAGATDVSAWAPERSYPSVQAAYRHAAQKAGIELLDRPEVRTTTRIAI